MGAGVRQGRVPSAGVRLRRLEQQLGPPLHGNNLKNKYSCLRIKKQTCHVRFRLCVTEVKHSKSSECLH